MAFEILQDKLQRIFKSLKGESHLTEANMDAMLKEIRVALLEADVNFRVVKDFLNNVKEKSLGQKVLTSVSPGELIVKIVHDEIVSLFGADNTLLELHSNKPTIIMLVGLQGTGKTTTAAKLANYYLKQNKRVRLAALDVYRPAATEQLVTLASSIKAPVEVREGNESPLSIAKRAKEKTYNNHDNILILDTAGRLNLDAALMKELQEIQKELKVDASLLLVDAAMGQEAVNVALSFNEQVKLDGVIMSRLDGDAKGGASLSIKHLTGIPIKFVGVGERIEDLDVFYPKRMADRLLGMGDIVTLVEKAQENFDEKHAKKTYQKLMDGNFDLNDLLEQLKAVKKMGSLGGLISLIPGMPKISAEQKEQAEKEVWLFEIIINSMTKYEKKHPEVLKF
ncbi:MAG: signal recognition particle protein, partial [Erysipelotrichaceae bacterium]|nr:signal recognition particle protein [Erysipelotrichaceae bacterium]